MSFDLLYLKILHKNTIILFIFTKVSFFKKI